MSEFKLQLEPSENVLFSSTKLAEDATVVKMKLTNPTKDRIVFKIKCTSNDLFRIRPPVGVVKAEDNTTVTLTFNPGRGIPDSGKHHFAVYYIKCDDDKKASRAAWADHKGEVDGLKRLLVDFKKEGEDEKKDEEKKEEEKKEEKKDDKEKEMEKEEEKKEEKEEKKE